MGFICFGSGSSGNCYYFYTEKEGFLIDAGIGLRKLKKYMAEYGLSMNKIQFMLLTHDHADHSKWAGTISEKLNIPVYATKLTFDGIDNNYTIHKKVDKTKQKVIEKDEDFEVGSFRIKPFEVCHDSMDCVGYNIIFCRKTFCLMTDIGRITPTICQNIKVCDYLIIESNYDDEMLSNGKYPLFLKERIIGGNGHLSNKQCGEVLKQNCSNRLQRVFLCHLSAENNTPHLALETVVGYNPNLNISVLKRQGVTFVEDLI